MHVLVYSMSVYVCMWLSKERCATYALPRTSFRLPAQLPTLLTLLPPPCCYLAYLLVGALSFWYTLKFANSAHSSAQHFEGFFIILVVSRWHHVRIERVVYQGIYRCLSHGIYNALAAVCSRALCLSLFSLRWCMGWCVVIFRLPIILPMFRLFSFSSPNFPTRQTTNRRRVPRSNSEGKPDKRPRDHNGHGSWPSHILRTYDPPIDSKDSVSYQPAAPGFEFQFEL